MYLRLQYLVKCSLPRAHTYNSTLNYITLILKRCCKISYLGQKLFIRPSYCIVTFKNNCIDRTQRFTGSAKQYQPSIQPTKNIKGIMLCFFDCVPNRRFHGPLWQYMYSLSGIIYRSNILLRQGNNSSITLQGKTMLSSSKRRGKKYQVINKSSAH